MINVSPNVGEGLYSPAFEHDACGVGAICNFNGDRSHGVVRKGIEILVNLTHRGASGCDPLTGDGAGILIQMPHDFFRYRCSEVGVKLPDEGEYGAGCVFLPRNKKERAWCRERIAAVIKAEGQELLGWREPLIDNTVIGHVARAAEPAIMQIFIGRGPGMKTAEQFERKLFVIRKVLERLVRESDITQKSHFYIPSLSCRTLVYKGLMLADQVDRFYRDLADEKMNSAIAVVHQRYSTNTFPSWDLAQPFRFLCHNGEINTLRGNINWMNARQGLFTSELFGDDMRKLMPICTPGASDSATLDNAVELLLHTGRPLAHVMSMLIPEAWQNHETMSDQKRAFYDYHACMMEPWDGPASIPFTDGRVMGALLDRNGLRPSRYTVTKDGFVIMGSESGVLEVDPINVEYKGRLEPGKMFLVDLEQGRIVDDEEVKSQLAATKPYRKWLKDSLVSLDDLPPAESSAPASEFDLLTRQQMYGYSLEDLRIILAQMGNDGVEPLGSMGADIPLAVLSDRSQLLYNYFKQLFAQVTNPPLDGINEELVTSMMTTIGPEQDLFGETPEHCHQLQLPQPVLTDEELAQIREIKDPHLKSVTLDIIFSRGGGGDALKDAMDDLCAQAKEAVEGGCSILILSDRKADRDNAPIPALLACSGVHHHLTREELRTRCGIIVETAEAREVHHFAVLAGYGCCAVNPYLAFETLHDMRDRGMIDKMESAALVCNYKKAVSKGILKVMCKMGISTLASYRGGQIFECVGIDHSVIDPYFTWTPSRLGGIGMDEIAAEIDVRYKHAFPPKHIPQRLELDVGGMYQWRRNGERHLFNPMTVAKLQQATRENKQSVYDQYAELINNQTKNLCTLRGLLNITPQRESIPLDEVEPWTEIVKRFKTGAMSYGSISREAHETLAIAMNRIGGKSNSGEGGEDERRFIKDDNGDWRMSAIKQVASGRFGVTSHYLANAKEIQIKMAQGAKPGEGGELPGKKVYPWIAKVRHSTPYVGLISPPPHHDIYSIEDLAQLIHDLKNANPEARINVKLVSEVGVGTVAAGVSKGKADVVLVSGFDGGTGAARETSIKHAGLPWELGLAETHQTLVKNDLRSRIVVECDGQLKTGRDVVVACLLGAEEFGFATTALVVSGCIMMRVCQKDTCPVGVATQNPELRKKYTGRPEYVVNFFKFVAEEMRSYMAELGFRTIDEMVGQVQCLDTRTAVDHWKARGLDLKPLLVKPDVAETVGIRCTEIQDHGLANARDHEIIEHCATTLKDGTPTSFDLYIRTIERTMFTMLSYHISKNFGSQGLPPGTIKIRCHGSGGQSFCAFGARGLELTLYGDANDYFCKGLSGAKVILRPPEDVTFRAEDNVIIGNVALYGATTGELYVRGRGGERFCVRNSGAVAVIEGLGDHGCEYMTGGKVVVLGSTGRNFAGGMSGGVAYVYDVDGSFRKTQCNTARADLDPLSEADERDLQQLIENHYSYTESAVARSILDNWEASLPIFVKVMPRELKAALARAESQAQMKETVA